MENIDPRIWTDPRHSSLVRVPSWASEMVLMVAYQVNAHAPNLLFVRAKDPATYGGQWFHEHRGLAIFDHEDRAIVEVVLLHELAHWLCSFNGDLLGHHDEAWQTVANALYAAFDIDPEFARWIDDGGDCKINGTC